MPSGIGPDHQRFFPQTFPRVRCPRTAEHVRHRTEALISSREPSRMSCADSCPFLRFLLSNSKRRLITSANHQQRWNGNGLRWPSTIIFRRRIGATIAGSIFHRCGFSAKACVYSECVFFTSLEEWGKNVFSWKTNFPLIIMRTHSERECVCHIRRIGQPTANFPVVSHLRSIPRCSSSLPALLIGFHFWLTASVFYNESVRER